MGFLWDLAGPAAQNTRLSTWVTSFSYGTKPVLFLVALFLAGCWRSRMCVCGRVFLRNGKGEVWVSRKNSFHPRIAGRFLPPPQDFMAVKAQRVIKLCP